MTTNTVESYFSIFKRGMRGVYQHCKEKNLLRYLAEYDFRYNFRQALGYNDTDSTLQPTRRRRQAPPLSSTPLSGIGGFRRRGFCAGAASAVEAFCASTGETRPLASVYSLMAWEGRQTLRATTSLIVARFLRDYIGRLAWPILLLNLRPFGKNAR